MPSSSPPLPPPLRQTRTPTRSTSISSASSTSPTPRSKERAMTGSEMVRSLSQGMMARAVKVEGRVSPEMRRESRRGYSPMRTTSPRPTSTADSRSTASPSPTRTRQRAGSLLSRHSPTHSRYSSSSSPTLQRHPPRSSSLVKGAPPSPPSTASDETSNMGGMRNGTPEEGIRRRSPVLERIGSLTASSRDKRLSLVSSSSGGTETNLRTTHSDSITSRRRLSAGRVSPLSSRIESPRPSYPASAGSGSEGTARHFDDGSPTRRRREDTARPRDLTRGASDDQEGLARRDRRERRAADLKEKNQRILDSINHSHIDLASPPPSQHSSGSNGDISPRRRLSTARTTLTPSHLRTTSEQPRSSTIDRPASVSSYRTYQRPEINVRDQGILGRSTSTYSEFGTPSRATSVRASRILASTPTSAIDRTRRDPGSARSEVGERSYTSMSSYGVRSAANSGSARRRADWLDKEYERARASSSFGDRPDEGTIRTDSARASTRTRPALPEFVSPVASRSEVGDRVRGSADRRWQDESDARSQQGLSSLGLPRPPRTTSIANGGSVSGSGGRRYASEREIESPEVESSGGRRGLNRMRSQSMANMREEAEARKIVRDDIFRNGLKSLEPTHEYAQPVVSPSAYSRSSPSAVDLQARKDRLSATVVGSDAWLEELQDQRRRRTESRASEVDPGSPQAGDFASERDRTLRAINSVLADQGMVASSTVGRRSPLRQMMSSQRAASVAGSVDSSYSSRSPRPDSVRSVRTSSSSGDHHKLLHQALEQFDRHFSPSEDREGSAPDSLDLVRRMGTVIASTTKINQNLHSLATASMEAQVAAELVERRGPAAMALGRIDKDLNSTLRASDDQIRSLTEVLISFSRVDRERDRLRRDGDVGGGSRPVSRAQGTTSRATINLSPKRPTPSSPFEGSTVSNSARSSGSVRQSLRNPLEDLEADKSYRRSMPFATTRSPRSPFFSGEESPTPSTRRDHVSLRSPLGVGESPSIASKLPPPQTSPPRTLLARRSKSTGPTAAPRVPSPASSIPFPRALAITVAASSHLDATNATTLESPTKLNSQPRDAIDITDRESWNRLLHPSSVSGSSSPEHPKIFRSNRLSTGSMGSMGAALRSVGQYAFGFGGAKTESALSVSPTAATTEAVVQDTVERA